MDLTVFTGLDNRTGRAVSGNAHLAQSIRTILTTPIGTRVMRRDFGSNLPALIDEPINEGLFAEVRTAVADALACWEPRLTLTRVSPFEVIPGVLDIELQGIVDGEEIVIAEALAA